MSLLVALILAQATPAAQPPLDDEAMQEIVILARKLRLVHVHVSRTPTGKVRQCLVAKSSGDPEVDEVTCDAARACFDRQPGREVPAQTIIDCTREEQARLIEALAEKRLEETP